MPHPEVLPGVPDTFLRVVPLEAHDTSYLADSANVISFSRTFSFISAPCLRDCQNTKIQWIFIRSAGIFQGNRF
jgi:hypothetical protein